MGILIDRYFSLPTALQVFRAVRNIAAAQDRQVCWERRLLPCLCASCLWWNPMLLTQLIMSSSVISIFLWQQRLNFFVYVFLSKLYKILTRFFSFRRFVRWYVRPSSSAGTPAVLRLALAFPSHIEVSFCDFFWWHLRARGRRCLKNICYFRGVAAYETNIPQNSEPHSVFLCINIVSGSISLWLTTILSYYRHFGLIYFPGYRLSSSSEILSYGQGGCFCGSLRMNARARGPVFLRQWRRISIFAVSTIDAFSDGPCDLPWMSEP